MCGSVCHCLLPKAKRLIDPKSANWFRLQAGLELTISWFLGTSNHLIETVDYYIVMNKVCHTASPLVWFWNSTCVNQASKNSQLNNPYLSITYIVLPLPFSRDKYSAWINSEDWLDSESICLFERITSGLICQNNAGAREVIYSYGWKFHSTKYKKKTITAKLHNQIQVGNRFLWMDEM